MATETARVLSAVDTILQPESVPFLKSLVDPTFQWLQQWGQLYVKETARVFMFMPTVHVLQNTWHAVYTVYWEIFAVKIFSQLSVTG